MVPAIDYVTMTDVERRFIPQAAKAVAAKYKRYGVTVEDCQQEILVWFYSESAQKKIRRFLAHSPQQTTRIRYSFIDRARRYAEKEKAQKCGYDPDDIHWYSESQVEALLPLALDETFTGFGRLDTEQPQETQSTKNQKNPGEANELLVLVLDIRRAVEHVGTQPAEIVQFLGGPRNYVGRKKIFSNAAAQAQTRNDLDG